MYITIQWQFACLYNHINQHIGNNSKVKRIPYTLRRIIQEEFISKRRSVAF